MSISSKIKSLLACKKVTAKALAQHLGISSQAMSNKIYRGSFSAVDLIKIANFLDCKLSFIISKDDEIVLTQNDIEE